MLWAPHAATTAHDLREELLKTVRDNSTDLLGRSLGNGLELPNLMAELARQRTLAGANGNKPRAAELVGLPSYQTLTNWMRRYDVTPAAKAPRPG